MNKAPGHLILIYWSLTHGNRRQKQIAKLINFTELTLCHVMAYHKPIFATKVRNVNRISARAGLDSDTV